MPNLIIWNDVPVRAQEICDALRAYGYECIPIIARTYDSFIEGIGVDLGDERKREIFLANNLIISDLLIGDGDTPYDQAAPFRDLARRLYPRFQLICFSTMAISRDVVGQQYFEWALKVTSNDFNELVQTVRNV